MVQGNACLHTTVTLAQPYPRPYARKDPPPAPSSRTRLAKDLIPKSSSRRSGRLEIAPRAAFERDSIPHRKGSQGHGRPRSHEGGNHQSARYDEKPSRRPTRYSSRDAPDDSHADVDMSMRALEASYGTQDPVLRVREIPRERNSQDRHRRADAAYTSRDHAPRERDRDTRLDAYDRARSPSRGTSDPERRRPARIYNTLPPLPDEFDRSTPPVAGTLPQHFTSPPLLPGLLSSLREVLGYNAQPTAIQALALKHLVADTPQPQRPDSDDANWRQYLLASETGSGKSIAYLLPLIQALKNSEGHPDARPIRQSRNAVAPRALVLAPTHELARQLATFAKALTHVSRLRVLCASRANAPGSGGPRLRAVSAAQMAAGVRDASEQTLKSDPTIEAEEEIVTNLRPDAEAEVAKEFVMTSSHDAGARQVDVLTCTPMKALEMARGRGWNRKDPADGLFEDKHERRAFTVGASEMGLEAVEWVIVDEADILFDPDFQETTRMLLADISAARGHRIPTPAPVEEGTTPEPSPIAYPFHLVLTTATIPSALASYLDTHHPSLVRLASPRLHRLPKTLQTEHVPYTGGNRLADVEYRLRRVWADDAREGRAKSKVLVFCNRGTRVEELGRYLEKKEILNVAVGGSSEQRVWGSNRHLDGFLKTRPGHTSETATATRDAPAPVDDAPGERTPADVTSDSQVEEKTPHVLITTSLLSRGLDFAPDIRHVFIVDSPRNMIDFLHRAGRSGRAGSAGKVVIFGKDKGRGSEEARDVRRRVKALAH